jgi:hypothetical protein
MSLLGICVCGGWSVCVCVWGVCMYVVCMCDCVCGMCVHVYVVCMCVYGY